MQTYLRGELVVVLDCRDPAEAGAFWSAVLGYSRVGDPVGSYFSLRPGSARGPELLLQKVPERKVAKNRLHLDLRTRDLSAEVERAVRAGAVQLLREPLDEGGWRWRVLADPDGNEFCVLRPPADHWT